MPVGSTRSINTYCWVYLSSDRPFQVYYKVPQLILSQSAIVDSLLLQSATAFYYKVSQVLLQSATGITKCQKFITKCGITKCDDYYNVRQNTAVRNEQCSRKKKQLKNFMPGGAHRREP